MEFDRLSESDENGIREMSGMATAILREYYDPLLGKEQNDYMLDLFQSVRGITDQLRHGYRYYFVREDGRNIGFMAFFPREDHMYLSKLYLKKEFRGKGIGAKMLEHVEGIARRSGAACVHLEVNVLRTTAQEFYRSHGYEVKEQLEYYRVIMQKRLCDKTLSIKRPIIRVVPAHARERMI